MTLPTGWINSKIGDVCDLANGMAFKPTDWAKTGLPIIRIQNLNRPDADFNYCNRTVDGRFLVENGELLFAWSGTPGTSFGAHVWSGGRAVLNQHIFRVRFSPDVLDKTFFKLAINAKLEELIGKAHGGVGLRHVTKGKFEETEIGVPPLAEQRRIVAKLDTLAANLTRARIELDRVAKLASSSRSAAISKLLAKMSVYDGVPLGETVVAIFDGPFGSNLKSSDYTAEGARVVRLENIGRFRFIGEKQTYVSLQKYAGLTRHTLKADDILFSSFVDEQIRVCRFPATIDEPTINKADCFAVRVDPARFDPRLLTFVLGAPQTYGTLKAHVHGATRPRVNIGILKSLVINLLPIAVQKNLADEVETAFARADRLEAEAARARALLGRLEAAILARAFRGELVPQDPADESASVLLDRIRAERAAAPTAKRARRVKEAA